MWLGWISVAAMAGGLGFAIVSMTGQAEWRQWASELPAFALLVRAGVGL